MSRQTNTEFHWRERLLAVFSGCCVALLFSAMAFRSLREAGSTNAYALIAESFLTLTPHASTCYGADCLYIGDKIFIIFPPFPALLALPLVWANGPTTTGFGFVSLAMLGISIFIWNRIFRFLDVGLSGRAWLLVATGFASPLFYVTLRADGVWFFAQATAFLFCSLAVHEALVRKSLVTAGLALAAALLSRQMSVFIFPVLYLVWLDQREPIFELNRERVRALVQLGLPVIMGVVCYLAWNYWRFGSPFETGYIYLRPDSEPLQSRINTLGVWHSGYVVFNFVYFFLQGFHAEFATPEAVSLVGLDAYGASFLASSPWLLSLFFARFTLRNLLYLLVPVGLTIVMLFYHSNGYSQYNTQRYLLDWLPVALLVLAPTLHGANLSWFKLLVTWGLVLNVATVVILAVIKGS